MADDLLDPPPTPEELAAAERLRDALGDPGADHEDVLLAKALRNAVAPRPIVHRDHQRILDRVVPIARPKVVWVGFASVFAAAAAIVIAVVSFRAERRAPPAAALVGPHTTQDLFDAPFPREGGTSKRVDAIVASRARELRGNRWARWGVK